MKIKIGSDRLENPPPAGILRRPTGGFTLIELLVVVAIIAILAAMLLPVLSKAKTKAQGIGCLNNTKQLTIAWHLYCTDNSDAVPNNYGVTETENAINNGKLDNWVNNVMTWTATASVQDRSNTNTAWVINGVLGKYTAGAVGAYKCPADNYLSLVQRNMDFPRRNRSLSMNCIFGRYSSDGNSGSDPTPGGKNAFMPQYRQYLKQVQIPRPAKTWLMLDEHPDSINDGYFLNIPPSSTWQDLPACYHNGACGFSFADGHSEIKKWLSATSQYRSVKYGYPAQMTFDALGRLDFAWYLERCGFMDAKTGVPAYNY